MEKSVNINPKLAEHMAEQFGVRAGAAAESGAQADAATGERRKSAGEKRFDRLTYVNWNHWTNLGLSVAATYMLRSKVPARWKNFGKDYRNPVGETSFRDVMVNWRTRKLGTDGSTGTLVDTLMLSTGGNITAVGVKLLEDRKEALVDQYNAKYSPEEVGLPLADQRKQTWFSVLTGRATVIVGVTAAMMGVDKLLGKSKSPDPKNPSKMLSKLELYENKFAEYIFAKPFRMKPNFAKPNWWVKLGKVTALDIVAVTTGSIIFWATSKALAQNPEKQKKKNQAGQAPSVSDDAQTGAHKAAFAMSEKDNDHQPLQNGRQETPSAKVTLAGHQHEAPNRTEAQLQMNA